jgi:hypothetical protein
MPLVLLISCTAAPPPEPVSHVVNIPPPAPVATAKASAAAPGEAPSAPPDAAPPEVLAKLSAETRAEIEVLAALCPIGVQEKDGKVTAGCRGCPSNATPDPERIPRVMEADETIVAPQAHLVGAFTRAGVEEHLVMMNSCSCNGCLDDAYLVHKEEGAFAVEAKVQVRSSSSCKLVRRKGQADRAICDRMLGRMGYSATTLEMYEFSKLPAEAGADLSPVFSFAAVDNLPLSCALGAYFMSRSLVKWRLADVDRDGIDDLVVELAVGDGVVNKAVLAACSSEDPAAQTKGLPPVRRMELVWTATPSGFEPDAATGKRLKALEAARKKALPE